MPPADELNRLLRYDPETGLLYWLRRPIEAFSDARHPLREVGRWNTRYAGKEALTGLSDGYRYGHLLGKLVRAHRVIWKMIYDAEPAEIDHINHNRSDNRLCNLRACGRAENTKNKAVRIDNQSGTPGVHWRESHRRWVAHIRIDGRRVHIGSFVEKHEAVAARRAAITRHGFHPNHGT